MTFFQLGVNKESGETTIWMEAPCGLRPILMCADIEGLKEFGDMLLDFYNSRKEEKDKVKKISNNLLAQALGNAKYFSEEVD